MKMSVSFDFVSFPSLEEAQAFSVTLAENGIETRRIEQDEDEWLVQPETWYCDDEFGIIMCTAYGTTPGSDDTDCFNGEPTNSDEALALMGLSHLPLEITEVTP